MRVSFSYKHGKSSWAHKFNSITHLDGKDAENARKKLEIEEHLAGDAEIIEFFKSKLADGPKSHSTLVKDDPYQPGDETDTGSRKRRRIAGTKRGAQLLPDQEK